MDFNSKCALGAVAHLRCPFKGYGEYRPIKYLGNLQSASPTGGKPVICLAKHGESIPVMARPPGFVLYSIGSPIKSMTSLCLARRVTREPIFSVMDRMSLVLNARLHMAPSHAGGQSPVGRSSTSVKGRTWTTFCFLLDWVMLLAAGTWL